mgnify:CR=1 FL=1|tara:strand:+ start:4367 stop:5200 length:834 start_codon:yes stop_codon:yes gene_type:complete
MEQLRKALLNAEKIRSKGRINDHLDTKHSISIEPKMKTYIANPKNADVSDIAYKETKVITLDHAYLEKQKVLSGTESEDISQAYKLLRTQVLQKLKFNDWNSLAIVSPKSGNGKTLTALNLAISLSQEVKHSVLLVDLDLKKPSVHSLLGLTLEFGITDYLLRDEPLSKILINPNIERLVILGGREVLEHSSEALGAPKLIRLVEELKERYPNRIIIFDLPPMLISDDAIVFAPYVDAVLLVVEEGKTTAEEIQRCKELLDGKPLIGSVLNKGEEHV